LETVMKKIKITSQYNRPRWTTIDHQQHDFELCANERKYERHTKIYTDGSKKEEEEVGYAVVWEEQTIKMKIHPQNSIYSAEQSAIINAIYSTCKK
jgi:hypothetical protein